MHPTPLVNAADAAHDPADTLVDALLAWVWWAVIAAAVVVAVVLLVILVSRTARSRRLRRNPLAEPLPGPKWDTDSPAVGPATASRMVELYAAGKRKKITRMLGVEEGTEWLRALDDFGPLIAAWVRDANRQELLAATFDADLPPVRLRGLELDGTTLRVRLADLEGGPAAVLYADREKNLSLTLGHEVQVTRPDPGVVVLVIDTDPDFPLKMDERSTT